MSQARASDKVVTSDDAGVFEVLPNVRYVDKSGNDAIADGSLGNPFKTVKAAQNSVTDASATNHYVLMIGHGTYDEENDFAPAQNFTYRGVNYSGNAPFSLNSLNPIAHTIIRRADLTPMVRTLSNSPTAGVPNRMFFSDVHLQGGLTLSKAAGDNTGNGCFVGFKNCTAVGGISITGSGTGASATAKIVVVDVDGLIMSYQLSNMTLSGCGGFVTNSRLISLAISSATVEGFLSSGGLGGILHSRLDYFTIDSSAGGSITTNLQWCAVQQTTIFKGSGSNLNTRDFLLGNQTLTTGAITSGSNIITGVSVPSAVLPDGTTTTAGIPVTGYGIPDGTITLASPGAGQIALGNAAGAAVNATQTVAGGKIYTQSQILFQSSAARSQLAGGSLLRQVYLAEVASDWRSVPITANQALNYLAANKLEKSKLVSYSSNVSVGGLATESMTITGLQATDTILSVDQSVAGANNTAITAFGAPGADTLSVTWSADPGAGAVVKVLVLKV